MNQQWTRTSDQRPDKNRLIEWISSMGLQTQGKYLGGAIWIPEGQDMYVYYTPEFWRYVD